jgi:hypothetical protein
VRAPLQAKELDSDCLSCDKPIFMKLLATVDTVKVHLVKGPPEMNEYESNSAEVTSTASSTPRRKWLRSKKSRWVASALVVAGLFGVTVGVAASNSGTPPASSAPGTPYKAGLGAGNGTSNARTAPGAGGTVGTIDTVSPSSFTLTTSTGQEVTVDDPSTTMYGSGTGSTASSVVRTGNDVLVLGTVDSTTIAATEVATQTTTADVSTAASVIPFDRGKPSTGKEVGTNPTDWSAGQGTLVSGARANEGTEAALAAYPGGIVDRVVKLSDGDYNVHFISVNWPHHVFLNASFQVIGAE